MYVYFFFIYTCIFVLTAIETESQPEVKIEKDLPDTKLCSLENDCNNSKILREVCKKIINLLIVIFFCFNKFVSYIFYIIFS